MTALQLGSVRPTILKRFTSWAVFLGMIVAGVAVHRWWPHKVYSDLPYGRVIDELHRLYPIYTVKHIRAGNSIEMDEQAVTKAKRHLAYVGGEPCWDLDVIYRDLQPGTEHEIEIDNREKLSQRKTFIRIYRQSDGRTVVSISSLDTEFLFNVTSRAFFYERQRLREIEDQLQSHSGPHA